MRYRSFGWLMVSAWLGAWPVAAHAADYVSKARTALQKGNLRAAQIDLRNAVRDNPQNGEAHYLLARVSFQLGDPVAAEREAQAAKDRGFDPVKSVQLLSQALLAQSKFQPLLDRLKPDGKSAVLDAEILVARGYALMGLRRPNDAEDAFKQAEHIAPNAVAPLLAEARLMVAHGDLNGAAQRIDKALAAQPKSAPAMMAKAQLLRLKNDAPGAIAVLNTLITEEPSVLVARLDRASLELALGRTAAARVDINTVLKTTPGSVQAIYLRAVLETQARNYSAANSDLERIAAFIPRIAHAYYLEAVVKQELGLSQEAEDAARKYLARAPNDLAGYKVLARIEFATHRPDQVVDTLAKVAASGKADAITFDLLGRGYAATGRAAQAVDAFQKAENLAPSDVGIQTRLASARMASGHPNEAMGDLEHTLQLAPKLPAVSEALFFAALGTGDRAKVEKALKEIRAAQGETDVVVNLEGLLKLADADFTGARTIFAALVKKSPDFLPAQINLARVDYAVGDAAAADKLLSDILAQHPTVEPALSMALANDLRSNKLDQAVALLERAHKADPNDPSITASLGDVYIRQKHAQKALDLVAAQKGSNATALAILSLKAAAYLDLGKKKEASDTYAAILKENNRVIGARRELVALLSDAGDFNSARNVIQAGIAIDPSNYQLYQDLALIDLKSTGLQAALATAHRLQSENQSFTALSALDGDIYIAADRPADAVTAYTQAAKAHPSDLLASRLATALLRAGQPDKAKQTLKDWIAKNQTDLVAMEQAAEINIATKDYPGAVKYLTMLLTDAPHNAVALNNLAWVYQHQGKGAEATATARKAYMLAPNAQTADTLGWILTNTGHAKEGETLLRQAANQNAKDPRIIYHFAVAMKDNGDKAGAQKALKGVIADHANFPEKAEAKKLFDQLSKGS